jgi:hypothetical protein
VRGTTFRFPSGTMSATRISGQSPEPECPAAGGIVAGRGQAGPSRLPGDDRLDEPLPKAGSWDHRPAVILERPATISGAALPVDQDDDGVLARFILLRRRTSSSGLPPAFGVTIIPSQKQVRHLHRGPEALPAGRSISPSAPVRSLQFLQGGLHVGECSLDELESLMYRNSPAPGADARIE